MSTKNKVYKGVRWSTMHMGVRGGLQLLQLAILARYLTPLEFGLIAILLIVYRFSRIFSESGISKGIIHKQDLSHDQLSSLFWLNILLGVTVFISLSAVSIWVSDFYDKPVLRELILINSIAFLFIPLGAQYRALFQKDLNFKVTSLVDISTACVGFIVTVTLAVMGYGVYSVIIGNLVNVCSAALLLFVLGKRYHRPRLILKFREVRDVISFGLYHLGFRLVTLFNTELDSLLIGKLLGFEMLGVYSLAKRLVKQPSQFVEPVSTKISFPVMAKMQKDKSALGKSYLHLVNLICALNIPVYVMIFFSAESIVEIFLGREWGEVVPILKLLCFWGIARTLSLPIRPLVLATGEVKTRFIRTVCFTFILAAAIYTAADYGLYGVALALTLVTTFGIFVNWYVFPRVLTEARFYEFCAVFGRVSLVSVICGFLCYFGAYGWGGEGIVPFVLFVIVFLALYLVGSRWFNRAFYDDMVGVLRKQDR